jgi:hypothetical protein
MWVERSGEISTAAASQNILDFGRGIESHLIRGDRQPSPQQHAEDSYILKYSEAERDDVPQPLWEGCQ